MANKLYEESVIQDIADATKELIGDDTKMVIAEIPPKIRSAIGGGGSGSDLPIAEQSSFGGEATGGNKFYYNGVLLPEIPSDVLAEYPYAYIRSNGTTGYYDLFFSTEQTYKISGGGLSGADIKKPYYRIEISGYETAEEWTYYSDAYATVGIDGTTRFVLWSNHDIYQATDSIPSLYFEATEPVPEVDDANWYQIKGRTMTDFADEAIRIGDVDTPLTPAMMLEIFEKVHSLDHDILFFDEYDNELAFYSIKEGHSVEAPVYACKSWQTEDGVSVTFPYMPTSNLKLYANNDTYASQLYEFYGIDSVTYPYLLLIKNDTSAYICFAKTLESNTTSKLHMGNDVTSSSYGAKYNACTSIGTIENSDIESMISVAMNKMTTVYDRTGINLTSSNYVYYSNFEIKYTGGAGYYRLDE